MISIRTHIISRCPLTDCNLFRITVWLLDTLHAQYLRAYTSDKGLFFVVFFYRRWPGWRRTMARDASSNVLLALYVLDMGGETQPGPDSSSINVFPTSTIE